MGTTTCYRFGVIKKLPMSFVPAFVFLLSSGSLRLPNSDSILLPFSSSHVLAFIAESDFVFVFVGGSGTLNSACTALKAVLERIVFISPKLLP